MARTAEDAALDFEMRMLLETKEAEANAARLEKSLTNVLNVFESIGKAATRTVGLITTAIKAPADLDNYLGSLNTKITNVNSALLVYRDTLLRMQGAANTPGSALFGFSPEDYQKTMMGFARGAAETEKYGAGMQRNIKGYAQGVGQLSKGIGTSIEETTGIITSFHRELGISYSSMDKFGRQLANIGRQSGMTSDQTKALYRTVTSLGRAYGLTGKNAEKFVLESTAVGAAISKIGLDANQVLRQMNEVATGSEEGLIQSLLLGFKPSDPAGQLKAFQDQAKMITQMAGQAGEQFAPFLTRRLADKLGMKNFSVEQIQAMARGESIETASGETIQQDILTVLKGIKSTMDDQLRAAERPYTTFGQTIQEAITKFITFIQEKFTPAMQELKQMIQMFIPKIIPTLDRWYRVFEEFIKKINTFFDIQNSPLKTLLTEALTAALATTVVPTILGMIGRGLAQGLAQGVAQGLLSGGGGVAAGGAAGGLAGGLARLLPTANPAAAQAAKLGVAYTGATGMMTAVGAASLTAIGLTILGGLLVGGAVGMIIDYFWSGPSKDKVFDKIYDFFSGKSKAKEEAAARIADANIKAIRTEGLKPQGERASGVEMAWRANPQQFTTSVFEPYKEDQTSFYKDYVKNYKSTPTAGKLDVVPSHAIPARSDIGLLSSHGQAPAAEVSPVNLTDNPLMGSASSIAQSLNLRRTDKPGDVHIPGSAHYMGMAQDYSIKGMDDTQIQAAVAALNKTGLYEASDERKRPDKLPAGVQWARHIHVEVKDELRNSAMAANAANPLSIFAASGTEMTVRDTESHSLLREIANKLGIASNTVTNVTVPDVGTPRTDALVASLPPLQLSPWTDMQMRSTKIMASGG